MRFSASSLNRWMACPKQAHFHDILDFPEQRHAKTAYGSCVHHALDEYNTNGDVDKAIEMFCDLWEDPSKIDQEITMWPPKTTWTELRDRGVACIQTFAEENRKEHRDVIASEHEFLVPFGDHTLSGFIDYLEVVGEGKDKELLVVDLKTSSRKPTHLELRMNVQFSVYLYASRQPEFWEGLENGEELYESFKDVPRRGIWYALWHNQRMDVGPREDVDNERLYRVALEVQRAIEQEVYIPNISGSNCIWCLYTSVCSAVIPIANHVEEARDARIR